MPYELTLAQQFADHLDSLPDTETGTILFDVQSTGACWRGSGGGPDQGTERQGLPGIE